MTIHAPTRLIHTDIKSHGLSPHKSDDMNIDNSERDRSFAKGVDWDKYKDYGAHMQKKYEEHRKSPKAAQTLMRYVAMQAARVAKQKRLKASRPMKSRGTQTQYSAMASKATQTRKAVATSSAGDESQMGNMRELGLQVESFGTPIRNHSTTPNADATPSGPGLSATTT